jgi:sugar phosphate isomerase/epimerase
MVELGIERLGVFGMPPVPFINLAADLGCTCVGMGLAPSGSYNPHGYPGWSLRDDAALRRETVAALSDRRVRLAILEGFAVGPGQDIDGHARDLDLLCELGGDRINVVSLDKDLARTIDGFAHLSALAAERNLLVSAEMGSLGPIGSVEPALAMAKGVATPNFSLLIDSMHFFRLGNTVEQLATMDPTLIGYAQLCDAPWAPRFDTYLEEALYERMVPGEGELPLGDFVRLLPDDIVLSLEIPMRALADKGVDPRQRLGPCVEAARALLARRA